MRVRHIYPIASCRKEVEGPVGFCIGSASNWFGMSTERQSRYEGWFIEDSRTLPHSFLKILERVSYVKGEEHNVPASPLGVTVNGEHAFWEYADGARIGFYAPPDVPALRFQSARKSALSFTFDIRGIYQSPDVGRAYQVHQVHQVPGGIFIQYDDPLIGQTVYVAMKTDGEFTLQGTWETVQYPWDKERNSSPTEKSVYTLGVCNANWTAFGAGTSAEAAQQACAMAAREPFPLVGIGIAHASDTLTEEVHAARFSTAETLAILMHETGTYAGLPWFHQVWSRDELLAALGMPRTDQLACIKKYLKTSLGGGELPTFVGSGTTCADGVGWLALLIREYGVSTLKPTEQKRATRFFLEALAGIRESHFSPEGLVTSGHNATWMDTIGRSGCRIEIQAMYGLALELLGDLTEDPTYNEQRKAWIKLVRSHFFKKGALWDGYDDATIRPNIFLAYLLQPDLLSGVEWERAFGKALAPLRTSWGGLASLDQNHPSFQAHSTGEDNKSYHQGDSWFFVNNLAGVALNRFGMKQFKPVVQEILRSSTEEILWKHTIGHSGEIASAADGASWGCGAQAFSAGTYLFFTEELGF
ncbi:MAG TPA: amylo-alpha-1,6-glucosidase [Verrucomicrobiae bacterium]|nr:amylo-alpha-1,6-glucosidase [Verrucomicrobiae bacterium]